MECRGRWLVREPRHALTGLHACVAALLWRVSEEGGAIAASKGDYIINVVTALRLFAPGAPRKKLANVPRGDNARDRPLPWRHRPSIRFHRLSCRAEGSTGVLRLTAPRFDE